MTLILSLTLAMTMAITLTLAMTMAMTLALAMTGRGSGGLLARASLRYKLVHLA